MFLTKPYIVFLLIAIIILLVGLLITIIINLKSKEKAALAAFYTIAISSLFAVVGIMILIFMEYGIERIIYALPT